MIVKKDNHLISKEIINIIFNRYKRITRAINKEFWDSESEINNSIFVGSYGRNTAISTSDIDILVILPKEEFDIFNNLSGNSQSRLLQAVRNAIIKTYPNTDIKADGQIVKINFSDGMNFEVLPAFENLDKSYIYPNSNMGGNWLSTNPKREQIAMREKDKESNGLLVSTCKHIRFIRDNYFKSYKLSGIVIDTFVYHAIGNWKFIEESENSSDRTKVHYEEKLLEYFNDKKYSKELLRLKAPGSYDNVNWEKSIECLEKVLNFMID